MTRMLGCAVFELHGSRSVLAITSVWISLATLVLAIAMVLYRPAMTDLTVTLVLYFGTPGSICLAGMVLWAYRKEPVGEPGIDGRRRQSKTAIGLAIAAAAIVYVLVICAEQVPIVEQTVRAG